MTRLTSTSGYAQEADALAAQYESFDPAAFFAPILHLFPPVPARVIDVGAGTGRDGAWLARQGNHVTLIEPTLELRRHGQRLHGDVTLDWRDDALPELATLEPTIPGFDLILCIAVLMHLDRDERRLALARIFGLLGSGGVLVLSLRYGPIPMGRRMFEVQPDEILAAAPSGVALVHQDQCADSLGRDGVTWQLLALRKT